MSTTTKSTTVSFPFLGILTLIFITLKLTGTGIVATWSWFWVLSPMLIPLGLVLVILAVLGVIAYIANRK